MTPSQYGLDGDLVSHGKTMSKERESDLVSFSMCNVVPLTKVEIGWKVH